MGHQPPPYEDGTLRPDFGFIKQFPTPHIRAWFDSFARNLSSPDVAIISDHEDDQPTQYAFSSPHLTDLSPEDSLCRAKKLLALVSGCLYLNDPECLTSPLTIDQSWYYDRRTRAREYVGQKDGKALEFPAEINQYSYRAWSPNHKLSTEGILIFLCHTDRDIFRILTILGHLGIEYSSLYSVLDCLKGAGVTEKDILLYAKTTKKELKRFTATANHFDILGVRARHGNLNWALPTDPPLSLEESAQLVISAARGFIYKRARETFSTKWKAAGGPDFKD